MRRLRGTHVSLLSATAPYTPHQLCMWTVPAGTQVAISHTAYTAWGIHALRPLPQTYGSPVKCFTNLPCAPGQFSSHLLLTVPTSSLFALISTSSTRLHSPSPFLSSSANDAVLRHLHVVRCVNPNGALMIHSTPSSVSVISASNVTVESHSPFGRACMWSVIL